MPNLRKSALPILTVVVFSITLVITQELELKHLSEDDIPNTVQPRALCIKLNKDNTCAYCWGGYPTQSTTTKCIPFSYGSNCLATISKDECSWCKPDYFRTDTGKCKAMTRPIQDCNYAFGSGGEGYCNACRGGVPSRDYTKCIPFYQLQKPIYYCVVGMRVTNPEIGCATCQSGYAANQDSPETPCVRLGNQPNCWFTDGSKCTGCRVRQGYEAVRYSDYYGQICALAG